MHDPRTCARFQIIIPRLLTKFSLSTTLASPLAGFNNHRLGLFALLLKKERLSSGWDRVGVRQSWGKVSVGVGRSILSSIGSTEMAVLFSLEFFSFLLHRNFLNCGRVGRASLFVVRGS